MQPKREQVRPFPKHSAKIENKKALKNQGFFEYSWRRGGDSNPR